MEIINIEARTFEAMMERFEAFTARIDAICNRYEGKKLKKWLTNQEVCAILNISKRKLQSLRDSGRLPYSHINRMMYYKPEDVQLLISQRKEAEDE